MAPGGSLKKPEADGQATWDYPSVRAEYVSFYGQENYVEWLVKAGEYLRSCWHAEDDHLKGRPLTVEDEEITKPLWDAYSRDDLDRQQLTALQHLEAYVQERVDADRQKRVPKTFVTLVLEWMGSAIVGALTLGAIAAFFVYVAPGAAVWAKRELISMSEKIDAEGNAQAKANAQAQAGSQGQADTGAPPATPSRT